MGLLVVKAHEKYQANVSESCHEVSACLRGGSDLGEEAAKKLEVVSRYLSLPWSLLSAAQVKKEITSLNILPNLLMTLINTGNDVYARAVTKLISKLCSFESFVLKFSELMLLEELDGLKLVIKNDIFVKMHVKACKLSFARTLKKSLTKNLYSLKHYHILEKIRLLKAYKYDLKSSLELLENVIEAFDVPEPYINANLNTLENDLAWITDFKQAFDLQFNSFSFLLTSIKLFNRLCISQLIRRRLIKENLLEGLSQAFHFHESVFSCKSQELQQLKWAVALILRDCTDRETMTTRLPFLKTLAEMNPDTLQPFFFKTLNWKVSAQNQLI